LAEEGRDWLAQADQAYQGRADLETARKAGELYQRALKAAPESFDAAWKMARAMCWLVEHAPKPEKTAAAEAAVAAGRKAVSLKPDHPAGHFWLGIAYGYYGDASGILKSLFLINPIIEEMNTVIKLDPGFEGGGAYMALGRLYHLLPGHNHRAVEYLETALKYGPRRWINHLYLAEVYADLGRKKEACRLLRLIIAGPAEPGLEPEYAELKAEAEWVLRATEE